MIKEIYQGPTEGIYDPKRFNLRLKLLFEGTETIFHTDPLPPYVAARGVYHIEPHGVTLHYQSPRPHKEATVTVFGSKKSIREIEEKLAHVQQLLGMLKKSAEKVRPDVVEALTRELEDGS